MEEVLSSLEEVIGRFQGTSTSCDSNCTHNIQHEISVHENKMTCQHSRMSGQCLSTACHFYLSMSLFHRPNGDHELASDSKDSCKLFQSCDTALRRRKVVNHSNGESSVEALVSEWERQVVTDHHLQHNKSKQ